MSGPGILLLQNLPESALAGIDLLAFTTSPRFQGIRNIPPGYHTAFVGTESNIAFSERHGVWFHVPETARDHAPFVVIVRWDAAAETLVVETDPARIQQHTDRVASMAEQHLSPYRQSAPAPGEEEDEWSDDLTSEWRELTSALSHTLLARITSDPHNWVLTSSSSAARDVEEIPGLGSSEATRARNMQLQTDQELAFLPVDLRQTWRAGATGRERTDAARDRSWALEHLISTYCATQDAGEVLGELQFCFIMVLTLNNYSCLEQWKRLLGLLLTCSSAVHAEPGFFATVIKTLHMQIQHCKRAEDSGLIDFALEARSSGVKGLLERFRRGLAALPDASVGNVLEELDRLQDYMQEEHDWDFGPAFKGGLLELADGEEIRSGLDEREDDEDDETGEFAPQIVQLTPEQALYLNV